MKRIFICFLLLYHHSVYCLDTDFDVVVVGTSPICLLEALYQYHSGNRVLILEQAAECGGSWKSIDICGVSHADLGCHSIGNDVNISNFLSNYVGCNIVSLEDPHLPYSSNQGVHGFYFSQGCYEIISHLQNLINATEIRLLLNHPLESVYIDLENQIAVLNVKGKQFKASKIITTPYSKYKIENGFFTSSNEGPTIKHYHLYLLIDDPGPLRFTFQNRLSNEVWRMMNLSYFTGLEGTGMQLIILQTCNGNLYNSPEIFLKQLKDKNFISQSAKLLQSEVNIYEQSQCGFSPKNNSATSSYFEVLSTGAFTSMNQYISKWENVLQPYPIAIKQRKLLHN